MLNHSVGVEYLISLEMEIGRLNQIKANCNDTPHNNANLAIKYVDLNTQYPNNAIEMSKCQMPQNPSGLIECFFLDEHVLPCLWFDV